MDVVQLIIDRLKTTIPTVVDAGGIKKFYYGDPDLIPAHDLPAIIVEQTSDLTENGSVAEHDVIDTVIVKVLVNKKDDWTGTANENTESTHKKLRAFVGIPDATKRYPKNSVKGALIGTLAGDMRIMRDSSVEYGIQPRPEDVLTAEAHVTVRVEHSVRIDNAL